MPGIGPRVWDTLAGHVEAAAAPSLADHGLDWIIERTVAAGVPFHDDRLLPGFTVRVAEPGLHLLSHECSAEIYTAQWVPGQSHEGWAGLLTVHTRPAGSSSGGSPRPLLALGDSLLPTRPHRDTDLRLDPSQSAVGRAAGLISLDHVPQQH
jgi:hypothetical protein